MKGVISRIRKSLIQLVVIISLLFSGINAQVLNQRVNEKEHILKVNQKGEIACQLASEKENEKFLKAASNGLNYTIVRSLN